MSQTYSREQVEQMINAKLAEQAERLAKLGGSSKATNFALKSGEFEGAKGKVPYIGVEISGNFRPRYVSLSVAKAILANVEGFKAIVESAPPVS
jgi:hypothetical protein